MTDRRNISCDNEEPLTDEELQKYLGENISEEDKNLIDKEINKAFESDALNGLQQIKDKERLMKYVQQLHRKLPQLLLKKHQAEKKNLNNMQWLIVAIALLLFLCIMAFVLIRMHL